MSTSTIETSLAICRIARWPYYRVRTLGARASAEPGELVVPISLRIDDALLRRKTATVVVNIPTPDTPTAEVKA